MKQFIKTKFFCILRDILQKDVDIGCQLMENSYDKFVRFLFSERATLTNKETYHDTLFYTLVELKSLTEVSGKNAVTHLQKAIILVDTQLEWVQKQILAEQYVRYCSFYSETAEQKILQWTGKSIESLFLIPNNLLHPQCCVQIVCKSKK